MSLVEVDRPNVADAHYVALPVVRSVRSVRGSASRPQDWLVGRIWILTGRSSPRLHAAGSALGVEIMAISAPESTEDRGQVRAQPSRWL